MKIEKLSCIMLIDNNPDDNFYHARVIRKKDPSIHVVVMLSATEALDYLRNTTPAHLLPDLIFLDINMPGMNGWDFIAQYKVQTSIEKTPLIIMLTTSENPDDRDRALASYIITDCLTKPLTIQMLEAIDMNFLY